MIEVSGGVVGVSDKAVFFSTLKTLAPDAVATLGKGDKAKLGEHGIVIEKDKVASVHAVKDAKFTTVISAKGMGDDIGVHALSEATQQRIVASVQVLLGRKGQQAQVQAGLFQRSGKSIVLAVCSLVLTAAFYYIVSSLHSDSVQRTGKNAGKEDFLYTIAHTLGPTGTLVAGGLVTALFVFAAFKNGKKNWVTQRYSF